MICESVNCGNQAFDSYNFCSEHLKEKKVDVEQIDDLIYVSGQKNRFLDSVYVASIIAVQIDLLNDECVENKLLNSLWYNRYEKIYKSVDHKLYFPPQKGVGLCREIFRRWGVVGVLGVCFGGGASASGWFGG